MAAETICNDCRNYRPEHGALYVCTRYRGMATDGVRECDGFESRARVGSEPIVLPTRKACLDAARDAVVGGREVAYGSPEDNFARIARLWAAYLHNKISMAIDVNEIDVALMLDLVKTARLQHNPGHVDSWVDKVGYSACGCEIGGRI